MKIVIIGHSGSGKSTLAKKLSSHYDISCLHLDTLQFLPNWESRTPDDFIKQLATFLSLNTSWVIDGVYSKYLFEERLEQADNIIYLNFNRWNTFFRILKRYIVYRGRDRSDRAIGCPEKMDWNFLYFALFHSRRPKRMQFFEAICQKYQDKSIILTNQKAFNQFLKSITVQKV
ncbi:MULTISPECIES: topology modulation protein [Streptococcus]|uniref:Topology modulation protein n=1 Tax=Streptococcus caledonicus TaxID=2614158 RepID=A0ABW0UGC4_9STRE|nr:topology modulation protein [Streptococcus sp. S784/96/1]